MFKKLVLGAAMLAVSAPVLAGPHHKHSRDRHELRRDITRQHDHYRHFHHPRHHHHYHGFHAPRPVVVIPPPHVYYTPAPVLYARPPVVYAPAAPYGGVSIRFNIPF